MGRQYQRSSTDCIPMVLVCSRSSKFFSISTTTTRTRSSSSPSSSSSTKTTTTTYSATHRHIHGQGISENQGFNHIQWVSIDWFPSYIIAQSIFPLTGPWIRRWWLIQRWLPIKWHLSTIRHFHHHSWNSRRRDGIHRSIHWILIYHHHHHLQYLLVLFPKNNVNVAFLFCYY